MKRLMLTLVAGAFGSLMVLPMAHAQDWQDMNSDAWAIRQGQRNIYHDKQELVTMVQRLVSERKSSSAVMRCETDRKI